MIDDRCQSIFKKLEIKTFIETGTDMGETVATVSQWFSTRDVESFGALSGFHQTGERGYNLWNKPIQYPAFVNSKNSKYQIVTIDTDQYSFSEASKNFSSNQNIRPVLGSSNEYLATWISDQLKTSSESSRNSAFYLDAHWGEYWPIRDEIKEVTRLPKALLVIDDFYVPGKSNVHRPHGLYGFDFYKNRVLSWGYLKDCFTRDDVRVFYSFEPNRDQRGWLIISVGYSEDKLSNAISREEFFEMKPGDEKHSSVIAPSPLSYLDLKVILKALIPMKTLRHVIRSGQRLGWL